jgi:hypothetical protein
MTFIYEPQCVWCGKKVSNGIYTREGLLCSECNNQKEEVEDVGSD